MQVITTIFTRPLKKADLTANFRRCCKRSKDCRRYLGSAEKSRVKGATDINIGYS